MKASDPHTFTKIQSNNNASQQRTMQGHNHQQQKLGPRGGQRGGREQYVARPPQPGNSNAYGTPPGRTASAPPNTGAGDMAQVPPQAFYPYSQGQPFVPNMYYQQQQMMMNPAMQQGAVPPSGQVMPQQSQQQRNPKQNQAASGTPMQSKPSGPGQQPKMSNGQPVPGSMPQFVQGYPRGPMPPHMAGMPMFPYQVPMYPGNPYAPPGQQQQQRPSPSVAQPREKKVLEIINPKTKETILPSKQKPSSGSKEPVPEAAKSKANAKPAATVAPSVEKESAQEENQSKEMNAAPVHDARAELLASAKRALESDKPMRKDTGDGKKGAVEKPGTSNREPVVGSAEERKKSTSTAQPTAVQLAALQQKERQEKQRAVEEEEQRKIAERKAREEEARRLLVAKEKEAAAAKEKLAKEKQDRLKAEIDAKKKMEEKKQALEKLERQAKSEPKVSALGNKINKPSESTSPVVVPTKSSSGKITYAVELLLQFRERFRDVPAALSPNVIDMTNIISKPKNMGRQQFSGGRDRGDGRHSHGRHGQQQPQRQSAGGQWQRRAPRGHDPRGGRSAPRPGGTIGLKVDPLKKTANAWKRQKASSSEEQALRSVTQILNKLSRENFEKLVGRILEINITSLSMLERVVELIRNKALVEPKFGDLYADLCRELQIKTEANGYKAWSFIQIIEREGEFFWTTTDNSEAEGYLEGPYETQAAAEKTATKRSELRRILLGQCQEEFEKENHYEELEKSKSEHLEKLKESKSDEEKQKIQTEIAEIDYKTSRLKQRILGNIQFIGELFKKGILTVRVLTWCVSKLMNQDETGEVAKVPDEESLECLCKLLTTIGEVYEKKADPAIVDNVFAVLHDFSNNTKLANRHRFMIKDVIDLRGSGWKARRKEAKAKKLDEIRKDVEKEQAAKKAESVSHSRIPRGYQSRGGGKPKSSREVIRSVATGSKMMSGGFKIGGAGNHTIGSQDVRQQPGPGRAGNMRFGGPRTASLGKSNIGGATGVRPAAGRPTSFRPGGGGGPGGSFMKRGPRPPPRAGSPGVGSAATPPKPKAPAIDESEMKRLIKNTLKEYGQVRIKKELIEYLKGLIPKVGVARKLKNGVVDCCLTFIAEGSQKDREATTEAMIILFEEKFLAEDNIKAALPPLLEFLPDIKMDAPLADKHLGSLLAALVAAKAVSIMRVAEFLTIPKTAEQEQLPSIKQCTVTIIGTMLQGIVNNAEAAALVKSKNITLKKLLGDKIDDTGVNDAIEKFKLMSLYSSDTTSSSSEKEFKSLISKDSKVDEILRWIQVNVKPEELQSKAFAKVVVVSALEHVETTKGVLANPSSVNAEPSDAVIQKEAEGIKEYSRLMKRVTSNDSGGKVQADIQVECLEGIAEFAQKYNFPPGLVKRLFKELYDNEVIKEEAYMAWKSIRNPSKAHETALAKSRDWLHWLETAEEESM